MADFNFVVDTTPMAESVSTVSNHVTATTAAVVAMQTAVIAAEKQSAKKICENVDKGFFNLIRSQISMKLSVSYTEMQAKLSLLLEYAKTLGKTQERMEGDFNRVKRQYKQIFKGIDKALENRISQLDKDAAGLAETRKKVITSLYERNVPETVVSSFEVGSTEQRLVSARIKNKTNHSLDVLGDKVSENNAYKSLMESMLDRSTTETVQQEYIPVIYAHKQSSLVQDSYVFSLHFPEYLSEQVKSSISLNILNQDEIFANDKKDDFERNTVSEEFQSLVASSSLDRRVAEKMIELFRQGGC